jgi:hypothetical protein
MAKQTVSKGIKYRYWYVKHLVGDRIKWCYIGKTLPEQYSQRASARTETRTGTQNSIKQNNLRLSPINQNRDAITDASIAQSVEQQPCKL